MYLDGADWEADYFLAAKEYSRWKGKTRALRNMLRNCAQSAGFISGDDAPGAMTGTIPGCDRTFLLENEQCTDPYYARNLEHTCYAEKYSWAFRKRFTVPDSWRGKRVELTFKGLDYSCRIFINGEWLGLHEGMFIPESYDVTRCLRSRAAGQSRPPGRSAGGLCPISSDTNRIRLGLGAGICSYRHLRQRDSHGL